MDIPQSLLPQDPILRRRALILLVIILLISALNYIGFLYGITIVLPHLFYIPIILAGYWFSRRGVAIAVAIALLYGALVAAVPSVHQDSIAIFSRMIIFVFVGTVISLLSWRLSASERQLYDIIGFLPDATFAIDREGRVIAWNRAMEELTGRNQNEMLGKGNFEYSLAFYPERRPMLAGLVVAGDTGIEERYPGITKEAGTFFTEAYLPHFHAGRGAHLRFSARALRDPQGNVTGAIESFRDVTDRVMLEAALTKTGNRLNTIAGITRHDISSRLAVLYGHLRLGVMKFHDPEVITFIASIQDVANSIKRQIDTSREFREIGTKPPAWISAQDAVKDAAGRLDPGSVAIRVWTERLEVFSDPHLPTVFYHIFHNSLKAATNATKIIVTYQIREDVCAIIIEDDGTGIRNEDKENLFHQREESYGRGLFLAHEILSITDMSIRENGEWGKGARFEILVPSEGYYIEGVES